MCARFVEETTKSSVAISPCFPVIYEQETFLTLCPSFMCTSKETYPKVHVIKYILEMGT